MTKKDYDIYKLICELSEKLNVAMPIINEGRYDIGSWLNEIIVLVDDSSKSKIKNILSIVT